MIDRLGRAMGWPTDSFRGFDQLDRMALPARAADQALRKFGRQLLSGDGADTGSARFLADFARGHCGSNAWIEIGRAEDENLLADVDQFRAAGCAVAATTPVLDSATATSARAYRNGRWDLVLQLADDEAAGDRNERELLAAQALQDWGLSQRLIERLGCAMDWSEGTFHGFDQLDPALLPSAQRSQLLSPPICGATAARTRGSRSAVPRRSRLQSR
jgi:hypothetical protein